MKARGDFYGFIRNCQGKAIHVTGDARAGSRGHAFVGGPNAKGISLREMRYRGKTEAKTPDKEPNDIAQTGSKKTKAFEHEGQCGSDAHCGQREQKERREQRPQMKCAIFGGEQLNRDGAQSEYEHHGAENGKAAEKFSQEVRTLWEWRGLQNLADAGLVVAIHRILHDVEAHEREESGGDQRDHDSDPRRSVQA